jgi:hypothetical protein
MNEKKNKKSIFGESDDGGAFIVIEFIYSKQVRFRMYIWAWPANGHPRMTKV